MAEPTHFSGRAPGGGSRSALVVGALIVAIVALAIAKPWAPSVPDPAPSTAELPTVTTAAETPAASPTAAAEPSVAPGPTSFGPMAPFTIAPPPTGATWTAITWTRLDASSPLATFGPATRWGGGFASLSRGAGDVGRPTLWTSPDASVWTPVEANTATTFWPGLRIEAIAPLGRRLLAVTSMPDPGSSGNPSGPVPTVLTTWLSDDGAVWQLRGGPIFAQSRRIQGGVLAAGLGDTAVIAWNEATDTGGAALGHVAVTTDGAAWAQVPSSVLPSGFSVADLAVAPGGGFLVAGKALADGLATAALIRSDPRALRWTPVTLPPEAAAGIGEPASVVWRLVVGPAGILAIGDASARELWWRSTDGQRWSALPGFDPVGASGCPGSNHACGAYAEGVIAGDGQRIVAVGGGAAQSAVGTWASRDGARWQRLQPASDVPLGRPTGITLLPGGLVLTDSTGVWYGEPASAP